MILSAVARSYLFLGVVTGANTAGDGRWAAIFLANFHFESVGTDYFLALRPPSPLQNFWSLSVEEQFYIVYPTAFLLVAKVRSRLSLRIRLTMLLVPVVVFSYWLSVVQTAHSPDAAYFSPLTRAWELALGAMIAIAVPVLKRVPARACMVLTWAGFGAILGSACLFTSATPYPGSLVAVPVIGAGLVIAGGVQAPRWGVEAILELGPAQWLGRLSYSLYLWHWPILVIAAQQAGRTHLSVWVNLGWVLVAVGVSIATYRLVENPVRHSRLTSRHSVMLGVGLVVVTLLLLTFVLALRTSGPTSERVVPAANASAEREMVAAAASLRRLPPQVVPPLDTPAREWGDGVEGPSCIAQLAQAKERICTIGDPQGSKLMVVYGDSHASMWLPAFQWIAKSAHWRLVVLSKPYCPALELTIADPPSLGSANSPDAVCDKWHSWATAWINANKPQVLVVTDESIYKVPVADGSTPRWAYISDWRRGLEGLFSSLTDKQTRTVILGDIPTLAQPGPQCLASHESDVQACSTPVGSAVPFSNAVEESTAHQLGVGYIDPIPWFCSTVCTAVIGRFSVYLDGVHINAAWATYLESVLGHAIHLGPGGH